MRCPILNKGYFYARNHLLCNLIWTMGILLPDMTAALSTEQLLYGCRVGLSWGLVGLWQHDKHTINQPICGGFKLVLFAGLLSLEISVTYPWWCWVWQQIKDGQRDCLSNIFSLYILNVTIITVSINLCQLISCDFIVNQLSIFVIDLFSTQ
jgi:hypothetical protein